MYGNFHPTVNTQNNDPREVSRWKTVYSITIDTPTDEPPLYFHRNYNSHWEHNNSAGQSKFSATKSGNGFHIVSTIGKVFLSGSVKK